MDRDTRFLLASLISKNGEVQDGKRVFCKAREMARGKPSVVVSDGFPAYIKTFENEFFTLRNPITKHICNMGFRDKMNNNYLHYHLSLVTAISPPSERFISMKLHIKIAKK